MISLQPIISEFKYSRGLSIPWEQVQQRQIAQTWHQLDGDKCVLQFTKQSKGWPIALSAMETEGGFGGAFTADEYNILLQNSMLYPPQVLSLVYRTILECKVVIDNLNLRTMIGSSDYNSESLFVGSVNLIRV